MTALQAFEQPLLACVNESVLGVRHDDVARTLKICDDRAKELLALAESKGLVQRLHRPVPGEFARVPQYAFRLTAQGRLFFNRPSSLA